MSEITSPTAIKDSRNTGNTAGVECPGKMNGARYPPNSDSTDTETSFEIVAKANQVLAAEGEAVEFVHVDAALTIQGRQKRVVLKQHVVAAA